MRDPIQSIVRALEQNETSVVVIWVPDMGMRNWLASEVGSVVPPGVETNMVNTAAEALQDRDRVVLLVPDDERDVVLELDSRRGQIEEPQRTQPIVIFLIRDGDGERALVREAVGLRSWVGGNDVDPEDIAEIDVEEGRAAFEVATGMTPEAWLEKSRNGEIELDIATITWSYRAKLLELP